MTEWNSIVQIDRNFLAIPTEGHLLWSQLLYLMNKAAPGIQESEQVVHFHFPWVYFRVEDWNSNVWLLKELLGFHKQCTHLLTIEKGTRDTPCGMSASAGHDSSIPVCIYLVLWVLPGIHISCSFESLPLMTESILKCLLVIYISITVKCLFKLLAHLSWVGLSTQF